MALMLADKNRALFRGAVVPEDLENLKVEDFTAFQNVSDKVFLADTYFRATNSDKITDPFLNGDPNEAWGQSQFEGQVSVARFFEDGKPSTTDDALFTATKTKGAVNVWVTRKGCGWKEELATGQEISVFVCSSDNPQEPQTADGYEKVISPQAVQKASLYKTLTA